MGNYLSYVPHSIRPQKRVMIFGLPASGKTSLLYWLKHDKHMLTVPTVGINQEDIVFEDTSTITMDFGICDYISYKDKADVVIYVVGTDKLEDVHPHFHSVISSAPILLLANKQDLEESHTHVTTMQKLNVWDLKCEWKCIPTVINQGIGISSIRRWVSKHIR